MAAVALAGCGGGESASKSDLAWQDKPSLTVTPRGARIVAGRVKNGTAREVRIKAPAIELLDQHGRPMKASAAFASSFVRSAFPQNGRPGGRRSEFPEAEQRRIGYLAVIGPGESLPLTVSWNQPPGRTAARIRAGRWYLPVPKPSG